MVRVIYGKKGSGKTKKIIDLANEAVKASTGELVFIDDDNRYMYDLRHEVRFVNATEYNVTSPETFMGFLCGILAGNYDMKQLFIDGFLRLVKSDIADLEAFFARLDEITHRHGVDVVISVSAKDEETPEYLKKYIQGPPAGTNDIRIRLNFRIRNIRQTESHPVRSYFKFTHVVPPESLPGAFRRTEGRMRLL